MKTKAVLFDVGNTLLHVNYRYLASLAGEYGYDVTPGQTVVAERRARRQLDDHIVGRKTETLSTIQYYMHRYFEEIPVDIPIRTCEQMFVSIREYDEKYCVSWGWFPIRPAGFRVF